MTSQIHLKPWKQSNLSYFCGSFQLFWSYISVTILMGFTTSIQFYASRGDKTASRSESTLHNWTWCFAFPAGSKRSSWANSTVFQVGRTIGKEEVFEQWGFSRISCWKGLSFLIPVILFIYFYFQSFPPEDVHCLFIRVKFVSSETSTKFGWPWHWPVRHSHIGLRKDQGVSEVSHQSDVRIRLNFFWAK